VKAASACEGESNRKPLRNNNMFHPLCSRLLAKTAGFNTPFEGV
jgi:hypothetical protein